MEKTISEKGSTQTLVMATHSSCADLLRNARLKAGELSTPINCLYILTNPYFIFKGKRMERAMLTWGGGELSTQTNF